MFDFGIPGYRPSWLNSRREVLREHGPRLWALVGRPLSRIWLVWDRREDEWFSDCPVLFDFDGEQVEINHWKFDDVSLTWNAIDPHRPPRWDGFDLEWRAEPLAGLSGLPGEPLKGVAVFLHREVSFAFEDATVGVYNALDENGLSITATPS